MYKYIYNLSLIKKYVFIAFILHLISSYFSLGFYKDDEHFQILEPVAYLLGFNNIILNDHGYWYWEWEYAMRPWFQSYLYYYIINFLKLFNINNPFIWSFFLRIFSSILGFLSIIYLFTTFKKYFFIKENHFNYLIFFSFWFYPFLHSRTSSENLGITLFIFSFCFLYKTIINKDPNFNYLMNLFVGLILGASLVIRLNLIFTILPIFLWVLIFRFDLKKIITVCFGVILSLSFSVLIDSINYKQVTIPYWNYFYWNIIWGRMADFGEHPWWFYFPSIILDLAPLLSIFFLIGLAYYWIKKPFSVFSWLTFFTLIIISFFSHKEIRYVFPVYVFAPLFIICFLESFIHSKWINISKVIIIFSNIVFLALTLFTPANGKVALYSYLHKQNIKDNQIYFIDENPYLINGMEPFYYTHFLPNISELKKEEFYNINKLSKIWILTNNYFDYKIVTKEYNCNKQYSSFPEKIINLNRNWKRHRFNWYAIYCN